MTTEKLSTIFGEVEYTYAEDIREFEAKSSECIIIAENSEFDGIYWQEETYKWERLNTLCHEILGDNLYGVANFYDQHQGAVIDSTESEEAGGWSVWVTNNVHWLYERVKNEIMDELRDMANKQPYTTTEEVSGQTILNVAKSAFKELMFDEDLDIDDALESAAKEEGLEHAC